MNHTQRTKRRNKLNNILGNNKGKYVEKQKKGKNIKNNEKLII